MTKRREYSDEEVKEDVKSFFLDSNHWAYQYAPAADCDVNCPYYKKQIQILFEDKYLHWVTDRAIETLIREGFLKLVEIIAKHTNEYKNLKWTRTNHNLDFIIEKDDTAYGIEIKNIFPYMPEEEFRIKSDMCNYFGIVPLFILRAPSEPQFKEIKEVNGFILKFKTKIFPPGQEELVKDMWNFMRLPVNIWKEIPPKIERHFIEQHHERIKIS